MDQILDFLNRIWIFLNHPLWVPLVIAVAGAVFFAVVYIKANRIADKYREEVQQKIVNDADAEHIRQKYDRQDERKETTTPSEDKN